MVDLEPIESLLLIHHLWLVDYEPIEIELSKLILVKTLNEGRSEMLVLLFKFKTLLSIICVYMTLHLWSIFILFDLFFFGFVLLHGLERKSLAGLQRLSLCGPVCMTNADKLRPTFALVNFNLILTLKQRLCVKNQPY